MTTLQPDEPTRADVDRFIRALGQGIDRAQTAEVLFQRLQWNDRKLRTLANAATRLGHVVCSSNKGYWLAVSWDEVKETVGRLRSQAADMADRANNLERAAMHSMAQKSLFQ